MAPMDPLFENDPSNPELFERQGRAGRQPSRPQGLAKRLQQLIQESKQWARRCEEVWFDHERKLELASGPNTTETLELYDEAIHAFQEVANWAAQGKKNLAKGKKMMKERLQLKKSQESGKRQKRT